MATGGTGARSIVLTPGEHPVDELAMAVTAASGGRARVRPDDLRADPGRLGDAMLEGGGPAIVVDQFEELFTLCDDEAERRCFVDALIATWRNPASHVVVILALRADFYGRVAAYPELAAAVVAHQALIGPMSQADLRRVIELPAAESGLLLQPGLTQTMLEDLSDEPGALPLLSHALLETWKRRRRLMLTVGGYREAGGVRGAIALTAERTLQALPDADHAVARLIFLSLTDVGDSSEPTRRRVNRAELVGHPATAESVSRVLGILADARLVTIDARTVVVAHEALIRHWPRLRGWIEADRAGLLIHRRLGDAAHEWDTLKREPGALYRGTRLAAAREWATDHAEHLSALEHEFLTASDARERAERAARRRRVGLGIGGLTIALVAISVVAFVAVHQGREATRQRDIAASRELAARATSVVDADRRLSLALARRAMAVAPTQQAATALRQALLGHLTVTSELQISPGKTTTATFAVKNEANTTISIPLFLVGARSAQNANRDFPSSKAVTLKAGETYEYRASQSLSPGKYTAWPGYYDGSKWHELAPHTSFTARW
jgi:hypothetical protein